MFQAPLPFPYREHSASTPLQAYAYAGLSASCPQLAVWSQPSATEEPGREGWAYMFTVKHN